MPQQAWGRKRRDQWPSFTVGDHASCGQMLDTALATTGPVFIEAIVDPFEPPMPPQGDPRSGDEICAVPAAG
jgi:pyruvate dehydrogenase (quinone)/pyruvate oxidase